MATIGFIGLGMMGRPMAERVAAAGHALCVHDASPAAMRSFVARVPASRAAAGPADFAACDVVLLMLPDSNVVEAVVLGQGGQPGLAAALRRGTVIIDMSSSQPLRTQALAARLASHGHRMLDAPVSGGVRRAVDGTLAIMVGGDADLAESQRALLATMGRTITHVGPVGAGHALKALNNYVSAAGLVAAVEALHVGRRFGLDPAVMTDVFNGSTGRNNTTENKVKAFMLSGRFDSGFSLALMSKDLGTAVGLGRDIGVPMELGAQVDALCAAASQGLGPAADHTEMYRWLDPDR